jgi:hypothetical protein
MRDAINNNPMVQLAVVGVLLVLAGVMLAPELLHHGGGSSDNTTTTSAQVSTPTGSAKVTVEASGTLAQPGTAATPQASGSLAPSTGTVSPSALIPGRGLPRPVVAAWRHGDAIVLLVARDGGIDDRLVRGAVEGLSGDSGTAVFIVRASHIARYSRITQGVGVSQVPALVVIRPKRLSGSTPQGQVTYGFRNSQSVVQQVHDALYNGKDNLPYSPR